MFIHTPPTTVLPDLQVKSLFGQRYYITPEGNKYPSVTTVLGSVEKPHIKQWQQMLGETKAKREQKRCADRGNAIHEMIEKHLNNDPNPTKGYKSEHIRGFNQLKLKLKNINNIRAQEAALYSDKLQVAGRVDCVGEYEGVLSIIDFKTSTNNKKETIIDDYFKQCTAYAIMWHELVGEPIENIVILMTVEKGIVPLVFKHTITPWVAPLLQTIKNFNI